MTVHSDPDEQQTGRVPNEHEESARLPLPTIQQHQVRLWCPSYMLQQITYDLCRPCFWLLPG